MASFLAVIVGVALFGVGFIETVRLIQKGEAAGGVKHPARRSTHDIQSSTRVIRFADGVVDLMTITVKR